MPAAVCFSRVLFDRLNKLLFAYFGIDCFVCVWWVGRTSTDFEVASDAGAAAGMGSTEVLDNIVTRWVPLRYIIINQLSDYLKRFCTAIFVCNILHKVNEGSLIDILRRPRFTDEFVENLLEYDEDDLWYLLDIFMEPIHHDFIRLYLLDLFG